MNKCTICLNPIQHSDCIELECKHLYHKECLKDWCKYSLMSPCCRKKIIMDDPESCSEDEASVSSEDSEYNVWM